MQYCGALGASTCVIETGTLIFLFFFFVIQQEHIIHTHPAASGATLAPHPCCVPQHAAH